VQFAVLAVQLKLIWVVEAAVALSPLGAEGTVQTEEVVALAEAAADAPTEFTAFTV